MFDSIYIYLILDEPLIPVILQNTTALENQMKHLVYLIENAVLNLPEGQEQMSWLIDFTGWSITNNVPIKSARETVNILQNHYPERLAVAFLYSPPRIFEAFWKVCFCFSFTSLRMLFFSMAIMFSSFLLNVSKH